VLRGGESDRDTNQSETLSVTWLLGEEEARTGTADENGTTECEIVFVLGGASDVGYSDMPVITAWRDSDIVKTDGFSCSFVGFVGGTGSAITGVRR
jgi:hypothetical protein